MSGSGGQSRLLAALLPSLTDVMFLLPLVFLFAHTDGASALVEGDTGWHLRTGEWILENGAIPRTDMFSFTHPGQPWFAWEWIWDVAFGWLNLHFGMVSVLAATIAVIGLTSAILFRLILRRCGSRFAACVFTFLATATASLHWWARPHVFSWLFFLFALWVVEWKVTGTRDLLWTLPVLTAFWANVHGGFVLVLGLLGCYLVGNLISACLAAGREERIAYAKAAIPFGVFLVLCAVASLANPYTYHLHQHIFKYLADPESPLLKHVSEWQSISFHISVARAIEVLIVTSVLACVPLAMKRNFGAVLLVLGCLHLGLMAGRNFPFFAFAAAPFAAEATVGMLRRTARSGVAAWLQNFLRTASEMDYEFSVIDSIPRLHLTSLLGMALVTVGMANAQNGRLYAGFSREAYPEKALALLSAEDLSGNIFTDDEWGDYLIYRLYPHKKVFVDGRFDFYGAKHTEDYLGVLEGRYNWESTLNKYQVAGVLLPVRSSLSSTLKASNRWVPVYDDGIAIMFRKREQRAAKRGGSQVSNPVPTGDGNAVSEAVARP